jgi:hypothetical protein
MASEKMAVSFDPELAEGIRRAAAAETGGNVSAWLAKHAEAGLRSRTLMEAIAEYEAVAGEITEAELEAVRGEWPRTWPKD